MWKHSEFALKGLSHKDTDCQDVVKYKLGNNVQVSALCDGIGSRKESKLGAETASDSLCDFFINHFDDINSETDEDKIKQQILNEVISNIKAKATESGVQPEEMGCTLLCVAIKENKYILFHFGDGLIGGYNGIYVKALSQAKDKDACNEVPSLFSSDAFRNANLRKGETTNRFNGFIMMSDGPANAGFWSNEEEKFANVTKNILEEALNNFNDGSVNDLIKSKFETVQQTQNEHGVADDDLSIALLVNNTKLELCEEDKKEPRQNEVKKNNKTSQFSVKQFLSEEINSYIQKQKEIRLAEVKAKENIQQSANSEITDEDTLDLTKKANSGDASAQYEMGKKCYKGNEYQNALDWFNKAAKEGYAPAQFALGLMYKRGDGANNPNIDKAVTYLKNAAEQEYVPAQVELGDIFLNISKYTNYQLAFQYFQKAAKQGKKHAIHELAKMYLDGKGCEKNILEAEKLFKQLANLGDNRTYEKLYKYNNNQSNHLIDLNNELNQEEKATQTAETPSDIVVNSSDITTDSTKPEPPVNQQMSEIKTVKEENKTENTK